LVIFYLQEGFQSKLSQVRSEASSCGVDGT